MLDIQMDILSNVHRRRLLFALMRENPQSDETETVGPEASHRQQAILMRHVHLPKLEGSGYIDWDRTSSRVTKGPQFDEIEPLLTLLVENSGTLSDDNRSD
jgi:hypothetical protein